MIQPKKYEEENGLDLDGVDGVGVRKFYTQGELIREALNPYIISAPI